MNKSPIELTLYDPETSEELKTLKTIYVPWGLLKKASAFIDGLDESKLTNADIDNMSLIVCACYNEKVTPEELEKGADIGEMMTVIKAIIGRVDFQDGGRGVPQSKNPLRRARETETPPPAD